MGIWFTLFLPAFIGGLCLGASLMAVIAKSAIKKYMIANKTAKQTAGKAPQKAVAEHRPHLTLLENCA